MIILMIFSLAGAAQAAPEPGPFELRKSDLKQYYDNADSDAQNNPIYYDKYGTPPDDYPAVVPGGSDYYDNETYYGANWTEDIKYCNSVPECSGITRHPYVPLFPYVDYTQFHLSPMSNQEWKCNREADCFGYDQIPDDLSNNTEVLVLRLAKFTSLDIGDLEVLPPLMMLRIETSDLRTIQPRVFESQPTLQALELIGNYITSLAPATFRELGELTTLDLRSNKIAELSRGVFEGLEALTELKITGNSLVKLQNDTFREMANLESIFLEYNNISVIYKYAFRGLPKLKNLYLNYNSLRRVPTLALRLPTELTRLFLTGNPLRRIYRKDFRGIENLTELSLNECEIATIAKYAFQGSNLQSLELSGNSLTVLPNMGRMKLLETVVLDYNPWICDCAMLRTVKWLKRESVEPQSLEPKCTAPEHLAGRQALELNIDDLCMPLVSPLNPVLGQKNAPVTTTTLLSGRNSPYSEDGYSEVMPEGGWSLHTNNPRKLYTVREKSAMPTASSPYTEPSTTSASIQTKYDFTTKKSTQQTAQPEGEAEEKTTVAIIGTERAISREPGLSTVKDLQDYNVTSRGTSLELTSKPVTPEFHQDHVAQNETDDVRSTISIRTTEPIETTNEGKDYETSTKPGRTRGTTYSIVAAIGVVVLLLVIGLFVFKVFYCKETRCEGRGGTNHCVELTAANGTASKKVANGKSQTDQNANSRSKPTPEVAV